MSMPESLRSLAARGAPVAPFGFEAFEQRCAVVAARRRVTIWSATGSIAVLGVVSMVALLTQAPQPLVAAAAAAHSQAQVMTGVRFIEAPALVDLDQFDLTAALEDHIAVLDDQLSAARVQAVPSEQLQQLESTRAQLNDSLQRVSYAHSLMSL